MAAKWPKYGFLTPESLKAFRATQQAEPAHDPKPKAARKPKRKPRRRSVWAIPTAFESDRRKH